MSYKIKIASIEEYKKALSQQDAILEQNIYTDVLSEYLKLGGAPMDAVNLLSESYSGIPSMCNVTSKAVFSMGLDSNSILKQAIQDQFKNRFDPDQCDALFISEDSKMAPEWLDVLLEDKEWRQTVYELIEKHPKCVFLNFAVLRISEAGHTEEVSKLRTTSMYLKVYNLILQDTLIELISKDDIEFQESLPTLARVCCQKEDTYLYTQILLHRLSEEYGATPFRRLRRELEVAAKRKGNPAIVDLLHSFISNAPSDLSKTIKAITNSTIITTGDLIALRRFYSSENPPATHYLCDYDLIIKMLKSLYVPINGSLIRQDLVDDVTFILAYATTMNDNKPRSEQRDDILKVQLVLKDLYSALLNRTQVGSITGAMKYIISAIRFPVGSMGVLMWIEHMAIHTSYFETYFRTKETPVLLLILDEIADRHQLQQPMVFDVVGKCIQHKYDFAPEIQLTLQKKWIDRMLYLVQLNYTIPVLDYLCKSMDTLDHSLFTYFVKKVLKMAQAPYSIQFITYMVNIIEPIIDDLTLITDVKSLVVDFLHQALNSNEELTSELSLKIQRVLNEL